MTAYVTTGHNGYCALSCETVKQQSGLIQGNTSVSAEASVNK